MQNSGDNIRESRHKIFHSFFEWDCLMIILIANANILLICKDFIEYFYIRCSINIIKIYLKIYQSTQTANLAKSSNTDISTAYRI